MRNRGVGFPPAGVGGAPRRGPLYESGYEMFASAARRVVRWSLPSVGAVEDAGTRGAVVATAMLAALAAVWYPLSARDGLRDTIAADLLSATADTPAAGVPIATAPPPRAVPAAHAASRTAFQHLDAAAAASTFRREFAPIAQRRPVAVSAPGGARITGYVGDRSAVVERGGNRRTLLVRRSPMRSTAGDGRLADVDLAL